MPPPLKNVPPVEYNLKPGAKPVRCRRPTLGPNQAKFLKEWIKEAHAEGLIEPSVESRWASRVVLVPKYRGATPKGATPDDVRVTVDLTSVCDRLDKHISHYPDPFRELEQAAGHEYYWEADVCKQFHAFLLAPGISREVTSFWGPTRLWRFIRMPMGILNASHTAQETFMRFIDDHFTAEQRAHVSTFQDDFLDYSDVSFM